MNLIFLFFICFCLVGFFVSLCLRMNEKVMSKMGSIPVCSSECLTLSMYILMKIHRLFTVRKTQALKFITKVLLREQNLKEVNELPI